MFEMKEFSFEIFSYFESIFFFIFKFVTCEVFKYLFKMFVIKKYGIDGFHSARGVRVCWLGDFREIEMSNS